MIATARTVPDVAPRRPRENPGQSRERPAHRLAVSAETSERWEAGAAPPTNRVARQRFPRPQEIAHIGLIVYTPEGFRRYLTPMPAFAGFSRS